MANKYDAIMQRIGVRFVADHLPVSELDILGLEKALGRRLPEDYRTFLAEYGLSCGEPYTCYGQQGGSNSGGVGVFYGINPNSSRDLLRKYKGFRWRIPRDYLAIADSPGGQICLGIKGKDTGKVFWWDRAEDSWIPRRNLLPAADSFDSFMNSLHLWDPPSGE